MTRRARPKRARFCGCTRRSVSRSRSRSHGASCCPGSTALCSRSRIRRSSRRSARRCARNPAGRRSTCCSRTACTAVWVKSAARSSTAAPSCRARSSPRRSGTTSRWVTTTRRNRLPPTPGIRAASSTCHPTPGARIVFRPIAPARRHLDLPPIRGAGLNAKELDAQIAQRVNAAKIDDQIVRLLVWDVDRATARDLDHAAIRAYKARALNFQLDLRRPPQESQRTLGAAGAGAKRQTLTETVRDFLGRRPLDAELNRETFVKLGVEYLETAEPPSP